MKFGRKSKMMNSIALFLVIFCPKNGYRELHHGWQEIKEKIDQKNYNEVKKKKEKMNGKRLMS